LSSITVEIPEGCEISLAEIEKLISSKEKVVDFSDPAEFEKYLSEHGIYQAVSARTYKKITWQMEIVPVERRSDPDRPVSMLGCLPRLYDLYANSRSRSANGYCLEVLERYMKACKFTSFAIEEIYAEMGRIRSRLAGKHFITYHFDPKPLRGDVYIQGKLYSERDFHPQQLSNIKKMYSVLVKTGKLELKIKDYQRKISRNRARAERKKALQDKS